MNIENVYTKVQQQLDRGLPFVVYRKGNSNILQVFFQGDNQLYEMTEYSTSGFIFSPFDNANKAILMPVDKCNYHNVLIPKQNTAEHEYTVIKDDEVFENQKAKVKHLKLVEDGVKAIASGDFKKVVLSRKEKVSKTQPFSALQLFQKLIGQYSTAFVYLWYHPKIGTWLGATPETLVKVTGDNFSTMALAGTQPYVDTLDVQWGDKEIVEQNMVKSFIMSELNSFFKRINSSDTYTYKAGTLLHLCTDINGVLDNKNVGIEEVVKILHPTPAVCGLPKNEAKSFILNNEGYDRKYYTGFLGELNMNEKGAIQSNIFVNLRCMELEGADAILYVGGGITQDSDPEKEWEETVKKTETMKKVLF